MLGENSYKVAIIGQGYVGFPLAMAASRAGHQVVGIDSNITLVDELKRNWINGQQSLFSEIVTNVQYEVTSDLSEVSRAEVVILCLPTPLNEYDKPDHSIIVNAARSLREYLSPGSLLINESTVEPGFNRGMLSPIFDNLDLDIAFSPERIDPGNNKWNLINTPKLVSGLSDKSFMRAMKFYQTFIDRVIPCNSVELAESAKLLENSYRLLNISFINEFAQYCDAMNLNVREVIEAASTKPYGFTAFSPSIGVGGHCIPVDPRYLAEKSREIGRPITMLERALDVNKENAQYYVEKASTLLGGLEGKGILIVGIGYKANVKDVRESAPIRLISLLRRSGANVLWNDEIVKSWNGECSSPISGSYDLVILTNEENLEEMSNLSARYVWDLHVR
jgi:UDP-N-acetyl-D-glucosamine dehydrogenase